MTVTLPPVPGCGCPVIPVMRFRATEDTLTPVRAHNDTCTRSAGIDGEHPQYGPDWVAGCYGVEVTDECPTVVLR